MKKAARKDRRAKGNPDSCLPAYLRERRPQRPRFLAPLRAFFISSHSRRAMVLAQYARDRCGYDHTPSSANPEPYRARQRQPRRPCRVCIARNLWGGEQIADRLCQDKWKRIRRMRIVKRVLISRGQRRRLAIRNFGAISRKKAVCRRIL
jgi:hypothetical protein